MKYGCPLPACDWTVDEPAYPNPPAGLAEILGTTRLALAETHHHQNMRRLETEIERHVTTHPAREWALALAQCQQALAEQVAMWAEIQQARS